MLLEIVEDQSSLYSWLLIDAFPVEFLALWNHYDVILTIIFAVFVLETSDQLNVLKEELILNLNLV